MAEIYKIYIDAGHGGSDPGIISNGLREKDLTLWTALATRDELERHGQIVKMSRTGDYLRSLTTICNEANAWGADLLVSEHYNGGGGDGAEFWCTAYRETSKADELGNCILRRIEEERNQFNRGLKSKTNPDGSDYFGAVRIPVMPSGIIESAFVDNKNDIKDFDTREECKKTGIAIAHGILDYLNIPVKKKVIKPHKETKVVKKWYCSYITNGTMNLREKPSTKAKIVTKVPANTKFTGKYCKDNWVQMSYNGKKGYIRMVSKIKK